MALSVSYDRFHSLPAPLTPLVGREEELGALVSLLTSGESRLITVTGPGGVGKTRLALRAGAELSDVFAGGVLFVDLSPLREPELVPPTIGQALGLRQVAEQSALEQITDALAGRDMLLILDNMEQVVDAAADLAALLALLPTLTVLVTSREVLRLSAEREFPLAPLRLPPEGRRPALADLARNAAVALFISRSQAVNPTFALTEENMTTVAQIVRRLDGLPLAIELAAARSKVLSPPALLARLDHRLHLLTGGARDQPSRLRTLRDAVAWSYDLLPQSEQMLFRRLAVFAGGFTLDAAETVAGRETPAVLDGIASLVDKSLIRRLDSGDDAEVRLGMLETVLAYARECLAASGDEPDARKRHAEWACALVETAEPHLVGPDQDQWLDRLDAERDNLRAALGWACESGEAELAQRLAGGLWRFWVTRGYLIEGDAWTTRAFSLLRPVSPLVHAKALHHLGNLALDLGDYDRAEQAYQAGLTIRRASGTAAEVATSLNGLGLVAFYQSDYPRARHLHEESLALRRQAGDQQGLGNSLTNLGNVANAEGDYAQAVSLHEEALAIRRAMGDTGAVAYSLFNLGDVARHRGDLQEARRLFTESLALFREVGGKLGVGYALDNLARVAYRQGEHVQAARLLGEALALRQELGDKRGLVECLEALAPVAAAPGQPETGARLFGAVDRVRHEIQAPLPPAESDAHAHEVESLRRRLGATAFDAAWESGRSWSLHDAVMTGIG